MKHLKLYENFQTEKEVADICNNYDIINWSINSEGLIDVDGNVNLSYKRLDKLPLKFGKVTGHFFCNNNSLISLEGSPKEVGGYFNCTFNRLTILDGAPKEVGGNFYCNNNSLTSLEGSPKYVRGAFHCKYNKLVSLEGAPDYVGGFYCSNNPISSLWKLFKDYSKIELFNYYDIVRELDGKPAIVLARLNQFLDDIGKQPVEKVDGYINIYGYINI